MPTKQIKIKMQARADTGQTTKLVVKIDGVVMFEDFVPETGEIVLDQENPNEFVSFDYDVPAANPTSDPPELTVTKPMEIYCQHGEIKVENIMANYTGRPENQGTEQDPQWQWVPGNSDEFVTCDIVSQPLWNGEALLDRYNIVYNRGPDQITGPGEILIYNGETVVFDAAIPLYSV